MARKAADSAHARVGVRWCHALTVSKEPTEHVDSASVLERIVRVRIDLRGRYVRGSVERSMTGTCQHVPVSSITPISENENGVSAKPLIS